MATKASKGIDFAALQQRLTAQLTAIDPNDPPSWPLLPRLILCFIVTALVVAGSWFGFLQGQDEALQVEQGKELKLRDDYVKKLVQAVNLEVLKKQRDQVIVYVNQLEKQLPSKAEMDALLSDINTAGLGRNLSFDLFRPGAVGVRAYYAELPIALRVTGRYHDIGAFASDIAHLSRIVTLNNLSIAPAGRDALSLNATARTFRYLDTEEVAAQSRARPAARPAAAGVKK
jgi:type IV pilus assembly protein PilO